MPVNTVITLKSAILPITKEKRKEVGYNGLEAIHRVKVDRMGL